MTVEDFVQQLQGWRQKLIDDVISVYKQGDYQEGGLAYDRWHMGVVAFLEKWVSDREAAKFRVAIFSFDLQNSNNPYDEFMRERGNKCLAGIDGLIGSAKMGLVDFKKDRATLVSPILPQSNMMRCPQCNRKYDDSLNFCLEDGSPLLTSS